MTGSGVGHSLAVHLEIVLWRKSTASYSGMLSLGMFEMITYSKLATAGQWQELGKRIATDLALNVKDLPSQVLQLILSHRGAEQVLSGNVAGTLAGLVMARVLAESDLIVTTTVDGKPISQRFRLMYTNEHPRGLRLGAANDRLIHRSVHPWNPFTNTYGRGRVWIGDELDLHTMAEAPSHVRKGEYWRIAEEKEWGNFCNQYADLVGWLLNGRHGVFALSEQSMQGSIRLVGLYPDVKEGNLTVQRVVCADQRILDSGIWVLFTHWSKG